MARIQPVPIVQLGRCQPFRGQDEVLRLGLGQARLREFFFCFDVIPRVGGDH